MPLNISMDPTRPGLSRFHHIGLVLPVLAAISMQWTSAMLSNPAWPQPLNALLAGAVVSLIAYFVLRFTPLAEEQPFAKAVLLGLVHAELQVFSSTAEFPSIVNITFFLFVYFLAFTHRGHSPQ